MLPRGKWLLVAYVADSFGAETRLVIPSSTASISGRVDCGGDRSFPPLTSAQYRGALDEQLQRLTAIAFAADSTCGALYTRMLAAFAAARTAARHDPLRQQQLASALFSVANGYIGDGAQATADALDALLDAATPLVASAPAAGPFRANQPFLRTLLEVLSAVIGNSTDLEDPVCLRFIRVAGLLDTVAAALQYGRVVHEDAVTLSSALISLSAQRVSDTQRTQIGCVLSSIPLRRTIALV